MSIAAELWLRDAIDTVEEVFRQVARNFTLRLAEKLAQYICSLTRERAPSGPVKVVVTNRPHSRRHNGIELVSGVSALLAWFPASWASKIAPCFIGEEGGSIQLPQEVAIVCPHREFEGLQRDAVDQVLQAVKFTEDFQASNCFTELIRGYTMGAVEPYTMMGLQPTGATRVTLEVIIPPPTGLTPEKWKQTATLCPLDWPSNYSLLRLSSIICSGVHISPMKLGALHSLFCDGCMDDFHCSANLPKRHYRMLPLLGGYLVQ